jgi:hypothetical protein
VVFSRVLWRTLSRVVTRTDVCNGNRESLRMALFSRDSILLWAFTTFARNRRRYAALRDDPGFAHLQWLEITRPAEADAAIRALARAGAGGQAHPSAPRPRQLPGHAPVSERPCPPR